jgi:hypothetical protein
MVSGLLGTDSESFINIAAPVPKLWSTGFHLKFRQRPACPIGKTGKTGITVFVTEDQLFELCSYKLDRMFIRAISIFSQNFRSMTSLVRLL